MENQREICLAEFKKSRLENTPMNWHIWKRAYDRGAANEANSYSDMHNVSELALSDAIVGDSLLCTRVYSQSKRYTVGVSYKVFKIELDTDMFGEVYNLLIRDDNDKLRRIPKDGGVSYTDFSVVRDR